MKTPKSLVVILGLLLVREPSSFDQTTSTWNVGSLSSYYCVCTRTTTLSNVQKASSESWIITSITPKYSLAGEGLGSLEGRPNFRTNTHITTAHTLHEVRYETCMKAMEKMKFLEGRNFITLLKGKKKQST